MEITQKAYEIADAALDVDEDLVMGMLAEQWPIQCQKAIAAMKEDDPSLDEDFVPNLSFVCDQVTEHLHQKFLQDLERICRSVVR